jgi:hypothetical protein
MNADDMEYLAKMRRGKLTNFQMANRLRITVDEVKTALAELDARAAARTANGMPGLLKMHEVACLQFQELGRTMGVVGFALGNQMTPEELGKLLEDSKGQPDPIAFIQSQCIILRPFIPEQIEQQMADYVAAYHAQVAQTDAQHSGSVKN